jgi:hypothetical protein
MFANKLLYIGAGLHINPVNLFANTKKFVFIDTLPRYEFSEPRYDFSEPRYDFSEPNYKILENNFYNNLISKFSKYNFILEKEININNTDNEFDPKLLIFKNNNQTVNYYISTNFLIVNYKTLNQDITESDGLIISSHYPNKNLLNYFTFPKKLFCYSNNIYNYTRDHWLDDEYDFSIFSVLDYDQKHKYFNEFNLIINDNKIIKFNSINELKIANKNNIII